MREILFRGKRLDNGEWVEGNLLQVKHDDHEDCFIIPTVSNGSWVKNNYMLKFISPCYEVDPETVFQYTGLTDKNEKKIFEGDILHRNYHKEQDKIVVWEDGSFHFKNIHGSYRQDPMTIDSLCFTQNSVRHLSVIGNIFDNHDLLTTSSTDSD